MIVSKIISAQGHSEVSAPSKWTAHFQITAIAQKHSGFKSAYNGNNSLADSVEPTALSLTSTLFVGRKLWKGASIYFNPEMSGGKGLSFTKGVAGALNGETYRVGATEPQVFVARAYIQQHFAVGKFTYESVADDVNQVADGIPDSRITLTAGKFAMSDLFDDNVYAKDPRTQFFNWSIWANGAWDYPADTRGYTFGLVAELVKPGWSVKASSVAVPRIANFHEMEYRIPHAHSETVELDHAFFIRKRQGRVRFILSNTRSRAPSYKQGLRAVATKDSFTLNVISGELENVSYGGKKLCMGANLEQTLTDQIGIFSRLGWNDGKYVSWAFTEIDRTASLGLSIKGKQWNRANDVLGIAGVANAISNDHRAFLKAGGYGFIIGDGYLDYGYESIVEIFYNARLASFLLASFDYQFVNNPGYNKDRGPAHVFAIRVHIEI
ncbi:MAG TPA: carbohydrate porin [Chitinophagaceae bacterium]|nr:carbohydrate porin [Chitinophagaceae bacterium]